MEDLNILKESYKELDETLRTLPEKLKRKIMVPFGKLAFFPGEIINTNKILVSLGENYFAYKSAKEAREVIERRKKCKRSAVVKLFCLTCYIKRYRGSNCLDHPSFLLH